MIRRRIPPGSAAFSLVLTVVVLLILAFPLPAPRGPSPAPTIAAGHVLGHVTASRVPTRPSVVQPASTFATSGTWTDLTSQLSAAPSGRALTSMGYDPLLHEIVLFGGYDPFLPAAGDTWTFNASGWTDITSSLATAPPARWGSSLVWDPNAPALVLFGGRDSSSFYNDTWRFNATG
ncbi:MAG TPA: kelch repeat-containing protein, partial [Thermoplasmata archaeon]